MNNIRFHLEGIQQCLRCSRLQHARIFNLSRRYIKLKVYIIEKEHVNNQRAVSLNCTANKESTDKTYPEIVNVLIGEKYMCCVCRVGVS